MPTYASIKKVRRYPAILKKFKKTGEFDRLVKKGTLTTRAAPSAPGGRSNRQIDITAIPGVRALKKNGKP